MLKVIPRTATKNIVKETTRELKLCTGKYLFNRKEVSNRGIKEQKHKTYRKQRVKMADINLTSSVITLNINALKIPIGR